MSRLFVAHDELLRREVVVKVLPPELLAGTSAERFQLEMQHTARLQHPHIVPVLSAGLLEFSGTAATPYYLMPLIEGETLRARIDREGALPISVARRILIDVADAVAHAHALGIIHRDLKPDNVFLVGDSALVSDFGISEVLVPTSGGGNILGVRASLGTPSYMAPEQAGGSEPDPRSDIYSLGLVAYEALTGQRPFSGETIHDLLVAQAVESPRPVGDLRAEVPPDLAAIVTRCIEKKPEDRFPNVAELRNALDALATASHPVPAGRAARTSWQMRLLFLAAIGLGIALVVVGWHHLMPGEETAGEHPASVALIAPEYFRPDYSPNPSVALVVDRVSTTLSRTEGLKVVNYMSVGALFRRGQTPTFAEVGRALGVEHLVVFAPAEDPRDPRVMVQLVEAPTQAQVWVARYVPDSTNLESVEADIVARVTHALLGPSARLPLQAHSARARREGAHAEYLAGMLALRRRTPDGVGVAIAHFEAAIRLDSTHVEATGRLATALGLQLSYGYRTTLASYPTAARALMLAERAVDLDPAHGEPVGFLAYVEYLMLAPLDQIRAHFNRAIRLRASEADVAGWNALMLLREGKAEQSLAESRRALELDPLSSVRHLTLALAALGARRYDQAGLEARSASEIEPELRRPRQVGALALILLNRGSECAAMDLWPHLGVKAMCLRAAGREPEAQALVDSLRRLAQSEGDAGSEYSDVVPVQELATYYAWVGNAPESLHYLALAFERSPVGIDLRIVQSGVYDRVREAPGFQSGLRRLLDTVWPRVLEQRRRIQDAGATSPIAATLRSGSGSPGLFPDPYRDPLTIRPLLRGGYEAWCQGSFEPWINGS